MKLPFQFHGDRREMYAMAREWAAESGMPLVEERFFPTCQARAAGDEGAKEAAAAGVDRVSLYIAVGEQTDSIIRESVLSAMTDDAAIMTVWKKCRRRAKKAMVKGVWVENVMSGARSRVAGHHYMPEAKRLAESGVTPMGGTDWIKYRFD